MEDGQGCFCLIGQPVPGIADPVFFHPDRQPPPHGPDVIPGGQLAFSFFVDIGLGRDQALFFSLAQGLLFFLFLQKAGLSSLLIGRFLVRLTRGLSFLQGFFSLHLLIQDGPALAGNLRQLGGLFPIAFIGQLEIIIQVTIRVIEVSQGLAFPGLQEPAADLGIGILQLGLKAGLSLAGLLEKVLFQRLGLCPSGLKILQGLGLNLQTCLACQEQVFSGIGLADIVIHIFGIACHWVLLEPFARPRCWMLITVRKSPVHRIRDRYQKGDEVSKVKNFHMAPKKTMAPQTMR